MGVKKFGIWGALFTIGAVVASWFTPGKQAEKLRNERDRLKKEIEEIKTKAPTAKLAFELVKKRKRIEEINNKFKNRES